MERWRAFHHCYPRVVDDQLLNEVARRILTVVQPDRIIVFGSAASGHCSDGAVIGGLAYPANKNGRVIYEAA